MDYKWIINEKTWNVGDKVLDVVKLWIVIMKVEAVVEDTVRHKTPLDRGLV